MKYRPLSGASVFTRYLSYMLLANLAWEIVQLPMYTLWTEGSASEIAFAVAHCTLGDVLIATTAWILAALVAAKATPMWPAAFQVLLLLLGVAYTAFSEWLNVSVRGTWAYSQWMPLVPWTPVGLTPILQWLVLPPIAMKLAKWG